jgi:hypothetical protein
MKKFLVSIGAIAILAVGVGARPAPPAGNDEARLAAALQGYAQAGPAVSCVNLRELGGNKSVGETAIIFEGTTRSRLWVNRPRGGCPDLENGRALETRTPTGQLCSGDIATVFDPFSRINYGSCGLGEFVPYRRVARR